VGFLQGPTDLWSLLACYAVLLGLLFPWRSWPGRGASTGESWLLRQAGGLIRNGAFIESASGAIGPVMFAVFVAKERGTSWAWRGEPRDPAMPV